MVANINIEVVFEMLFLTFSKVEVDSAQKKLIWRIYTAAEALTTTKKAEIINQKKFVKAILDPDQKTFLVYITTFTIWILIYLAYKAQISIFIAKKIVITISAKYFDFVNVFPKEFAVVLLEYTKINSYLITLEESKQPLYELSYCLELVELEILKTYIKTNLVSSFIQPSKSSARVLILFDKKFN